MKKIMILTALACSFTVFGQFNTGSVYFSGMTSGNIGTRISEGMLYLPFNISAEGGYFLKNKIALGGELHTHGEFNFNGTSSYELRLGPTIRYYRPSAKDCQMYFFGHAYYGFWNSSYNQWGIEGGVGFNYFVTERIALEARGGYNFQRQWDAYTDPFTGEVFRTNFNNHHLLFEVGISVFFPSIKFFDRT